MSCILTHRPYKAGIKHKQWHKHLKAAMCKIAILDISRLQIAVERVLFCKPPSSSA